MQYVGEALGYACIALIRSFGPASLAGNSFATFWTVTAGFLLNPISFPIYLRYIGTSHCALRGETQHAQLSGRCAETRVSHRSSINAGYTSPFQYAYAALAVVEYKDNEYDCPYPPENPLCLYFDGTTVDKPTSSFPCLHVSCVSLCVCVCVCVCVCMRAGNYILSQQNLIFDTLRPNLLIVGAMAIGFRIIALLILVLFKRKP
jgi:hypothetical protein